MPQVTLSYRLRTSGYYLSRTVTVDDTPRPAGYVEINHRSIHIHRYVRTYLPIALHQAGDWIERIDSHLITPHRRKLVSKFTKEQP